MDELTKHNMSLKEENLGLIKENEKILEHQLSLKENCEELSKLKTDYL